MQDFVTLFRRLDQTTKSTEKINALVDYFHTACDQDKVWTIALFSHRRPKRTVTTSLLRLWAAEIAQLPDWLFEDSYHIVGDLAETIALILPNPTESSTRSLDDWIRYNAALKDVAEHEKKAAITAVWQSLDHDARFLYNKLITGGFRIGVSQKTIVKALSKTTDIDENTLSHRLMGDWDPFSISYTELVLESSEAEDLSKPYPFYLAYALESEPSKLGDVSDWIIERKWDGIRGQLILRDGKIFIWSRGEELMTAKFPELAHLAEKSPTDVVIDGEIIPYRDGKPLPFNLLQTRIGRKTVAKKHLVETPIHIIAYDLLEYEGQDIRDKPMEKRRSLLEKIVEDIDDSHLLLSDVLTPKNWEEVVQERNESRAHHCEGLMLKKKDSVYKSGRKKGDWWKWKVDPMTIDAVMLYAQRGHGRRANLYTDYTFAVWDGELLVPFAKAYSGLTDEEFKAITKWVRANTKERFGPVASVNPELVFELAFEGIAESKRHKSGIALRFPRIKRWRTDKPASEADTLDNLKALLSM